MDSSPGFVFDWSSWKFQFPCSFAFSIRAAADGAVSILPSSGVRGRNEEIELDVVSQ